MPIATLTTNLSNDKIPKEFNKLLTEFLVKLFDYPVITALVQANENLTISGVDGGLEDPAVLLEIKGVPKFFSPFKNINYSKNLSGFIHEHLGVIIERVVIHFIEVEPYTVGNQGTTLEEIWKNS